MLRPRAGGTGAINNDSTSYRRGLVLGFTMAEVLLLLVFCLLIAVASLLAAQRDDYERMLTELRSRADAFQLAAEADRAALQTIKDDPGLADLIRKQAGTSDPKQIDDFWRKLVDSGAIVSRLEGEGLSRDEIRTAGPELRDLKSLKQEGVSASEARSLVPIARTVRAVVGDAKQEALRDLLGKGMAASGSPPSRWPPLIRLGEADGFFFRTGSAEVTSDFEDKLHAQIAPKLLEVIKEYGVDVVEVVGHTDDQPIRGRASNLDRALASVLNGELSVGSTVSGDNAGLGLARAVSVANLLLKDRDLRRFRILPMSSGQLVRPDQTLSLSPSGDVQERRRIEIRLRKSD